MEDVDQFIEYYRPKLLSYLDAKSNDLSELPGPLEFIKEVLDCWSNFAEDRQLSIPSPAERTFWFALYQLEDLVEYPAMGQIEPYEGILLQNLAQVRELLRDGGILPDGFFASRSGEEPGAL